MAGLNNRFIDFNNTNEHLITYLSIKSDVI